MKDGQRDRWTVHVAEGLEGTCTQLEGRTEGQKDGSCKDGEGLRECTYRQSDGRIEGQVEGSCKDGEGLERVHTHRVKDVHRDRWMVHVRMERA